MGFKPCCIFYRWRVCIVLDIADLPQATKLRRTIIDSDVKKEKRRIAHSTPGSRIVKPARKKKIITELE